MSQEFINETDLLMETPYFTLKNIDALVRAAKQKDINPDELRFFFGQRHDLSANPFQLSAHAPKP